MRTVSPETAEAIQAIILQELPGWVEENPTLRRRLQEALREASTQTERDPTLPDPMTYEEFLDWADEDTLTEWVALPGREKGKVVMYSPASEQHQRIAGFLITVMGIFVEQRDLGVVLGAPFQMKLERSGREPDVIFVAQEHLDRLQETYLDGPADLVVEIVSPESIGRDRGEKFYEYAEGGVPEYWLLDPSRRWAEFYQLGKERRYEIAFIGREGVYHSEALPGFWLRVEWLWQDPLPKTLDVLRELGVV